MTRPPPKVFVVQRDFPVGALCENRAALCEAAKRAHAAGASVMLSPELALTGYSPEDLLHDPSFVSDAHAELARLAKESPPELAALVGAPWRENDSLYNAAALIRGGTIEAVYRKNRLPNYSVFDERRHFNAGDDAPMTFDANGTTFAAQICHDIWSDAQAERVKQTGAQVVLCPNASPFYWGKHATRIAAASRFAKQSGAAVVYAHGVGGQDELVFDGASFAVNSDGKLIAQLPFFAETEENIFVNESENESGLQGESESQSGLNTVASEPSENDSLESAIVMALRDFARKNNFSGALLGLSGGVDSALAAALAAKALGGENLTCVMMPSRHTSRMSLEDAAAVAKNLGAEYFQLPIDPIVDSFARSLSPKLKQRDGDVTMENIQSRARGVLLMALANNGGRLLLATGNKSEFACGYATLYGDMCGGFAPLKDLTKTKVWELAKHCNRGGDVIPARVITRPPTAELRDNQTDQDTLPPYAELDAALETHLNGADAGEMESRWGTDFLSRFHNLLRGGEHKRRQAAVGPKLTERAFGRDWRMPVANRYHRK